MVGRNRLEANEDHMRQARMKIEGQHQESMGHWPRQEEARTMNTHQLPKWKRPSRHGTGNMLVRPIGRNVGPVVRVVLPSQLDSRNH